MKKSDNKRKKYLAAAIALFFATSPFYASAKDYVASGDYLDSEVIEAYGKDFAEINYVSENTGVNSILETKKPLWDITYKQGDAINLTDAIKKGLFYWSDMLGKYTKNKTPWQIFVNTDLKQNASAGSASYLVASDGKNTESSNTFVSQQLQDGKELDTLTPDIVKDGEITQPGTYGFSEVTIGKYMGTDTEGKSLYGWYVDEDTVLPTNESSNDFIGTVRHEFGHALGIGLSKEYRDWEGKIVTADKDKVKTSDGKYLMQIAEDVTNKDTWTLHLRDQNDNPAKAGMPIVTSQGFADLKAIYPDLKESDCFIVDDEITSDGKGYAYFYGDNVSEVLDGATFFGRNALPVNGWEGENFEGSHLQTSGMMSHRNFSNYTAFMEAELAVMQDLGYTIDRKAYFGYSVYGNDKTITNKQGYSARNEDGTAYTNNYSEVPLGIGLHIYGARNNVTQEANVLTKGDGATGIRVDGTENTVNIAQGSEIHADGYRGNGLLVSYGKNQTINQYGDVTAEGEDGVGARFDFGSSSNGATDEYRGSYIRYKREVNEDGNIDTAKNLNLTVMTADEYNNDTNELEGAQVKEYNIAGVLKGGSGDNGHAIYIAKNAFVKDINVNSGASISGDIVNDWKHFTASDYNNMGLNKSPIKIQYNGKYGNDGYDYTEYNPELTTNLNFNTDIAYDGNITGADNTKITVKNGVLSYGGTADVVNVTVDETAGVYGGTFKVNNMSSKISEGYTDTTTGQFINHGAIGAGNVNSTLLIKGAGDNDGKLVSDGVLIAVGGGSNGNIEVQGTADIEGSSVLAVNYLPDETGKVLTATKGITGNVTTSSLQSNGMMNTEVKQEDENNLVVTAVEANNLGDTTSEQNEMYNAMNAMRKTLKANGDASGLNEMRVLYGLDATNAKSALTDIGGSSAADMAAVTQQNSAASNAIGERLNTAFDIPRDNNLNNDIWVNIGKHWGDTRNGANYHGTAIAGGYDKAVGKNWRLGAFVGYNSMGFSGKNNGGNAYDTRVGVYGLYKKGAADAYIYANVGWLRNKYHRGIPTLGLSGEAKSGGHIYELGGEYKQELHNNQKLWRVSPYFNMQLSQLRQGGYGEEGLGVYGHHTDSLSNTYFAGQIGLEMKRVAKLGNYGARIGVKHAFSGAEPSINYHFEGDPINSHRLFNKQDKTHFIFRLFGDVNLAQNWKLAGDARLQKGSHDKDIAASVTLRKMW